MSRTTMGGTAPLTAHRAKSRKHRREASLGTAGCFLPFGSIFPAAYFSVRPLYFREIFRRKFIFFKRSHTHQRGPNPLPSALSHKNIRGTLNHWRVQATKAAPHLATGSSSAPPLRDDGKTKVSRASPTYFPGSKSYFLAGVGIFPPIFPEIENDKRRHISDNFSGKIQPCQRRAGKRVAAAATRTTRLSCARMQGAVGGGCGGIAPAPSPPRTEFTGPPTIDQIHAMFWGILSRGTVQ